jgi:hypothetical protein
VRPFLQGPLGVVPRPSARSSVACDRYNRRAMYLLSGTLTAVCGIVIAVRRTETTLIWGVLATR